MYKKVLTSIILFVMILLLAVWVFKGRENKKVGGEEVSQSIETEVSAEPKKNEIIEVSEDVKPKFPVIYTTKGKATAEIILDKPSLYGQIKIFDSGDVRCLVIDGISQSCWLFGYKPTSGYVARMGKVLEDKVPEDGELLVVGLGGGTLLKYLKDVDFKFDIVEINPALDEIAKKYFSVPDELNYEVTYDDGRHYVLSSDKHYDAITLDLCEVNDYNVHLRTVEFWKEAKSKLKSPNDGLVAASLNIVVDNKDSEKLQNMVANSMFSQFKNVYSTVPSETKPGGFDTINFFATDKDMSSDEMTKYNLKKWKTDEKAGFITDENTQEAVRLNEAASKALRDQLINNYGEEILLPR